MEPENIGQINRRALFCDENGDFRIPPEPEQNDQVKIKFRTGKNDVDAVFYIQEGGERKVSLKKIESDKRFDYYECLITVSAEPIRYWFHIEKGEDSCYYHRLGAVEEIEPSFAFQITPGFHTPDWAKGAVMYQIFVDRFYNGDTTNDVQDCEYIYIGRPVRHIQEWSRYPSVMDVGHFYGGDLQGVWDKLDYLQELGVEVLYFNPLFVSPSNHKYDTQDYDHIDPHYGKIVKDGGELVEEPAKNNDQATKYMIRSCDPANLKASDEFFECFLKEVHRRGMRVIIDGVFNHCGSFNKWLDREQIYKRSGLYDEGAYCSKKSPYHSFFKFQKESEWPNNESYDGWWGHKTLPKLNFEGSEELWNYIMGIARKWVSPPYEVEGWRLDVAADLGNSSECNHRFWKEFRKTVKGANPDALILAEHYGDPSSWLQGDEWDTIMNYDAFMEPLTWFLTGMEKHSDEYNETLLGDGVLFFRSMFRHMSKMHTTSVMTSMNELSNHDHSRFMTRTKRKEGRINTLGAEAANEGIHPEVFREAVLVQMTWPGAPTIYYGDEAGVCGWTDPDNRRTYPWGYEDKELIAFHQAMIQIHKQNPALRRGSLKQLLAGEQLIAYGRFCKGNYCVVAVNNGESSREIEIPVWEIGVEDHIKMTRVMLTTSNGYHTERAAVLVENGNMMLTLERHSGIVLICDQDSD